MIKDLEIKMWEAAKANNSENFLKLVDENAIMVCGGYRCTGREYAEIIKRRRKHRLFFLNFLLEIKKYYDTINTKA